nr:MAG TPA: hypothetical protein [Caudoviricetes sp.]
MQSEGDSNSRFHVPTPDQILSLNQSRTNEIQPVHFLIVVRLSFLRSRLYS